MKCTFLNIEGKCSGPYAPFGCISEKCNADKRGSCEFNEKDFYCRKFQRFECIGKANCGSLDNYMAFVNARKFRSHSSK